MSNKTVFAIKPNHVLQCPLNNIFCFSTLWVTIFCFISTVNNNTGTSGNCEQGGSLCQNRCNTKQAASNIFPLFSGFLGQFLYNFCLFSQAAELFKMSSVTNSRSMATTVAIGPFTTLYFIKQPSAFCILLWFLMFISKMYSWYCAALGNSTDTLHVYLLKMCVRVIYCNCRGLFKLKMCQVIQDAPWKQMPPTLIMISMQISHNLVCCWLYLIINCIS